MKRPRIYFWEESPGVQSSIRIQMFLTMFFAFYITDYMVRGGEGVDIVLLLILYIAAFVPKMLSKVDKLQGLLKDGRKAD